MKTLLLPLVLLVASCGGEGVSAPTAVRMSGSCMGTSWSAVVTLQPGDEYDEVEQLIQAELDAVDTALSTWKADSDVSRLNRATADEHVPATKQTLDVLRLSDEVVRATDGAFDPTVGPLVRLWGFGAYESDLGAPTDAAIAAARERLGWDAIVLGPDWVARSRADVEIDTSAVAKGYSVDLAAEALVASGHAAFLLEVGGEVVVRGSNPDGDPWRVGVDDPLPPEGVDATSPLSLAPRAPIARLGATDCAIATSGDYRNVRVIDGRTVSHTIDPRSGRPVEHALASATVVAASCGRADALATAALVLGPVEGLALLERIEGVEGYLLVRTGDADEPIEARMTSGMAPLLLEGSLTPQQ